MKGFKMHTFALLLDLLLDLLPQLRVRGLALGAGHSGLVAAAVAAALVGLGEDLRKIVSCGLGLGRRAGAKRGEAIIHAREYREGDLRD